MAQNNSSLYVGLDIGTANVRTVIITNDDPDGKPSVIGYGAAPNIGMRRGNITHVDDVTEAIIAALSSAERLAGVRINHATVNVNSSGVVGTGSKGVIAISGAGRVITEDDRARAEDAATVVKLPPNREIIQVFAKDYAIDGQSGIKDPVDMTGVRLEVNTQLITATTSNLRTLDQALEKAQITSNHHTVSSLAAAEAVMTRQQKEAGTALVDIGAGTTNVAVLEDGEIQHVGVIPIGSMHLTNDLAIGLKTDLDVAEKVKLEHAGLDESSKGSVKVKHGKSTLEFKQSEIAMITAARMEELFEYVDKELAKIHKSKRLPGGIILSGGGSKIDGLSDFSKELLELPVRVGTLQPIGGLSETVADPSFFTATGLALLDMLLPTTSHTGQSPVSGRVLSVFDNLKNRFR